MLSFAVGSLLGDVFLHLLPEVWTHIDEGVLVTVMVSLFRLQLSYKNGS